MSGGRRPGVTQDHKTAIVAEDLAWERDAACRDHNPDLFFPERGGRAGQNGAERAIAVCNTCPLDANIGCARKAINGNNRHGVWAGVYYGNGSRQKARAHEQIQRIAALELSEAIG